MEKNISLHEISEDIACNLRFLLHSPHTRTNNLREYPNIYTSICAIHKLHDLYLVPFQIIKQHTTTVVRKVTYEIGQLNTKILIHRFSQQLSSFHLTTTQVLACISKSNLIYSSSFLFCLFRMISLVD